MFRFGNLATKALSIIASLAMLSSSASADPTEDLARIIYTHFVETYFSFAGASSEIEKDYPIVRWQSPISIATNLAGMEHARSVVAGDMDNLTAEMSTLGYNISIVDHISDANVRMVFFTAGKDSPEKVYKVLDPSVPGYDLQFQLAWRAFSKRSDCAMGGLPSGPSEVGYAFAFVNIAQPDENLRNCVIRMIFGLLGFQESEGFSVSPTVFDARSGETRPYEIDLLALRVLADPRLKKGMKYDQESQRVIRDISRSVASSVDAKAVLSSIRYVSR